MAGTNRGNLRSHLGTRLRGEKTVEINSFLLSLSRSLFSPVFDCGSKAGQLLFNLGQLAQKGPFGAFLSMATPSRNVFQMEGD